MTELDEKIRTLTGFVPNTQIEENDIFIVGYMKSGTTWFRNLVAGAVFGFNPALVPFPFVYDLVPNHGPKKPYIKRYCSPMYLKSHSFPVPEYRRVVYLLRDGRDVLVSLYHHLRTVQQREIDFLELARGEDSFVRNYLWHKHVETWLTNPYQAEMLVIRYEDLHRDGLAQLRRFCEFVGIDRDDAFLAQVVEQSKFEKLRHKEETLGIGNHNWPEDRYFMRRGQIGSYKDEMPPDALEAFMREAGETLRRLGYLDTQEG